MKSTGNKKLANLIIAGVNKAGSTSLFHYLSAHPEICGSKDKETCFFLPLLYNEPLQPISVYEDQFTQCTNSRYRLEATPAYIFGGEKIASEIEKTLDDVKIIIILKNPVDRLVSFYQRKKATFQLPEELTLSEYVKLCLSKSPEELLLHKNHLYTGISFGMYYQFIEPWLKLYGKNIKVVFFDDFKKDSSLVMKDLAHWLEIDKNFYNDFEFDVKNKSLNYKNKILHRIAVTANNAGQRFWRSNPDLKKQLLGVYYKFNGSAFKNDDADTETKQFLRKHFIPANEKLNKILNSYQITNLPKWIEKANVPA